MTDQKTSKETDQETPDFLPVMTINGTAHLEDSKGRFVPLETVKDYDRFKTAFVIEFVQKALALREELTAFKRQMLEDVQAHVDLSNERYGVTVGGTKGNVTLTSFKGDLQIVRVFADQLSFNEALVAAKALIDECILEWSDGANPNIRALVQDAFQTDRQGKISTERVLGLRRLKIEDPRWARAMEAISDSIMVQDSKPYIRFRRRNAQTGAWENIALDLAAL